MKKIDRQELIDLILGGITEEELKAYDYSNVLDMSHMFYWCDSLISIPYLDTSNVTNMSCMFYSCKSLISIPELNTSKVVNMNFMLAECFSLTSIPELYISNTTDIYHMLENCYNIEDCFYNNRINYNETNSFKLKQNYPEYFI